MNGWYDMINNKNGSYVSELFINMKPVNLDFDQWFDELLKYNVFNENYEINDVNEMNLVGAKKDNKLEIINYIIYLMHPVFNKLPIPVLHKIVLELDLDDIINLCQTNSKLHDKICKNKLFWITLFNSKGGNGHLFVESKPQNINFVKWINELIKYGIYDNNLKLMKINIIEIDKLCSAKKMDIINYLNKMGFEIECKECQRCKSYKTYDRYLHSIPVRMCLNCGAKN